LLLIEATRRLINIANDDVNAKLMLITSSLGIGFNVLNIILLEYCFNPEKKLKQEDEENKEEDKKRQINVRAACFSIASNLI
jgi:Co/Zn/Cd efflux system component